MATPQTFLDAVREAQREYSTVCSKLRCIFRETLPEVHALQSENAYFSSRLMRVMYAKAKGRLSERSYHDLGAVLQRVESAEPTLTELGMALKREPAPDSSEFIAKATGLAGHFCRCSADIDSLPRHSA